MAHDVVIRNGTIYDGVSEEPFVGDIAVDGTKITEVGRVEVGGVEEFDATGLVVTPGFIDPHTHYDGQAIWSERLSPSSLHGVTTVVLGNCGVGFAPCRPEDHDLLVNAMEGVEDIPEVVMTTGLPWNWETFPEYLSALGSRKRDIDVAAFVPHSPLRVYAMGKRGAEREVATREDIAKMTDLVDDAMATGAVGFATSRLAIHRRGDLEHLPTFEADESELEAIAARVAGKGVMQIVTNLFGEETLEGRRNEIAMLGRISASAGVTVTFSFTQSNTRPELLDTVLEWIDVENAKEGVDIRPQFAPRPIGAHLGFSLSTNPFDACATYRALSSLPLEQRIVELRKPEIRERIINEPPGEDVLPIVLLARQFDKTYPLSDPPNYEPDPDNSVAAIAARTGREPAEVAYDLLLEDDGHAILYLTLSNYGAGNLDHVRTMFDRSDAVLGLGDGGAHYGIICDATYPTFVLTHWTQQRPHARVSLGHAVNSMSSVPAGLMGFADRGRLAPGLKADINVIDYDHLRLSAPRIVADLPGGGQRVHQTATGYRRTFVSGKAIVADDQPTGALPGGGGRGPGGRYTLTSRGAAEHGRTARRPPQSISRFLRGLRPHHLRCQHASAASPH